MPPHSSILGLSSYEEINTQQHQHIIKKQRHQKQYFYEMTIKSLRPLDLSAFVEIQRLQQADEAGRQQKMRQQRKSQTVDTQQMDPYQQKRHDDIRNRQSDNLFIPEIRPKKFIDQNDF